MIETRLNELTLKSINVEGRRRWLVSPVVWVGLYVILSLVYLLLGQPNADEGWCLYASRLVFEGKIPYQDFAYTQMPLLPYVYGVPQIIFSPSILVGRATSIVFSVATVVMCVLIARRYAGDVAGGVAAMLAATFTYGIYFNSIVKTYALVSFFFTLTFYALSSRVRSEIKFPLAVLFALSATMVRLSAIAFAIPIIVYCLIAEPRKQVRAGVCLLCLGAVAALSFLFLPNTEAATWNLVGYHFDQWGNASAFDKLVNVLSLRIPFTVLFYGPYVLLAFVATFFAYRNWEMRSFLRRNSAVFVVACGLALFFASHLESGTWLLEYFVPGITAAFPIIAIVLSRVYRYEKMGTSAKLLVPGAMIAAVIFAPLGYGTNHIDLSGQKLPLQTIDEVSSFVYQHTVPTDRILALEALSVAIASKREALPGMTLAQFSYQNVDRKKADELKVVNYDVVSEYISAGAARAIVFTEDDWETLEKQGTAEKLRRSLLNRYEQALQAEHFGQHSEKLYVYLRRSDQGE